jgi:hypothetical protein
MEECVAGVQYVIQESQLDLNHLERPLKVGIRGWALAFVGSMLLKPSKRHCNK